MTAAPAADSESASTGGPAMHTGIAARRTGRRAVGPTSAAKTVAALTTYIAIRGWEEEREEETSRSVIAMTDTSLGWDFV